MHWADKFAEKLVKKHGLDGREVIETGTSISGIPHIGNASDVIRGDAVRKALLDKGASDVGFIWVADDSDPFRKVPKGMENLRDYLGFPVYDLPDSGGCHKNFVEHFVEPFVRDLGEFGVKPQVYSGTGLYRSGALYPEIKTALQKKDAIRRILDEERTEPLPEDYLPWNPICGKCGRISTTKPLSWDGADTVEYVCVDRAVAGGEVKGCGHQGKSDLRNGLGKLPWRVEWAARWHYFKVTCEPLGKEHASAGGSYWTSKIISKKIFSWKAPVPVIYEFFTLNGAKISSSEGNVITLGEWLKIAEPEVLKFSMYKRLKKQRDINLKMIPQATDEYDEAERLYFNISSRAESGGEAKKISDKDREKLVRMYRLSQINEPAILQVSFNLCAILAQIVPDINLELVGGRLERLGYTGFDLNRLRRRLEASKEWVRAYGSEDLKFSIIPDEKLSEMPELSEKQVKGLSILAEDLNRTWSPEEFHKRIYETARSMDLKPPELFSAIYLVLTGKTRGPKAAALLLSLDKGFVQGRFKPIKN